MTGNLRPLVDRVTDLPTLPAVAGRLLRLLAEREASAADVTDVLEHDMALSARLLRVVNSPFYGFRRRIHHIGQAVVITGFQHLRTMALSVSVIDSLGRPDARMDYPGFWRHALATAIWARDLVAVRRPDLADSAYLAGLLHDVGKLTLAKLDDGRFAAVVAHQRATGGLFIDAERALMPFDHPRLGAALLEHWNFPDDVTRAVAGHHAPAGGEALLADAVHAADILTRAFLIGWAGDARIPRLDAGAWGRLGVGWEEVDRHAPEVFAERGRAEAFFYMGHTDHTGGSRRERAHE